MNKMIKKATILLCICTVAMPLMSCGKNGANEKENTPEEAVKTYVNIYKKEKDINYNNIGVKEEELKELANKRDYNLSLILMLGNEKKTNKDFWNNMNSKLGKVEVNVKSVDVKDDKASVNISSKSIDLDKIHIDALKNTKKNGHEKQTDGKKSSDIYLEYLNEELANLELSEEKNCTVNLEKTLEGKWVLENDSIAILENAITSENSYKPYTDDVSDEFKEAVNNL